MARRGRGVDQREAHVEPRSRGPALLCPHPHMVHVLLGRDLPPWEATFARTSGAALGMSEVEIECLAAVPGTPYEGAADGSRARVTRAGILHPAQQRRPGRRHAEVR